MEDSVGIVVVCGERGVHAYGVCILDSSKRRCVEVGALSRGDSVGNQLVLRGSIHVYGVCIIDSFKRRCDRDKHTDTNVLSTNTTISLAFPSAISSSNPKQT